jgi:hypothetical protein
MAIALFTIAWFNRTLPVGFWLLDFVDLLFG